MKTEPESTKEFREEQGEIEFTTEGTCVKTTDGWREMPPRAVGIGRLFLKGCVDNDDPPRRFKPVSRVGIFSKRDLAATALPDEWDSQTHPQSQFWQMEREGFGKNISMRPKIAMRCYLFEREVKSKERDSSIAPSRLHPGKLLE